MKLWKLILIFLCAAVSFGFTSNYPGLGPGQVLPPGLVLPSPILESPTLTDLITTTPGSTLWIQGNTIFSRQSIIQFPDGSIWKETGLTFSTSTVIHGPDGSTWTNSGINDLKNLNIATGGAITFHGVGIGGQCAANQYMVSLSSEIIPHCAAITVIPGPVTIHNPTFTGTMTMPDGSVWNNTGLSFLTTNVINGPDGSVWNSTGIHNVKNISIVTGGTITVGGQPVSGGAHVGPTAPSSPVDGQLWYDTSTTPAVLKIWSGTAWVVAGGGGGVSVGPTAPSNPSSGNLWSDTSTTPPSLKVWNGTAWVATNSAFVNATAPSNASEGQFWFNTTDLQTYVRFNGQWVAVVNIVGGGGGAGVTVGPTAPANPKTGELWYDSVAGALKVWNGSTWAATSSGGGAPGSITDAMLVGSYSGIGACPANQYVNALTRNAAPTCAPVTLPAGIMLNNPTFTGTITLPDGSTWTSAGLTIVAGSRAATLDSLTGASGSTTGALSRASNGSWSVAAISLPSGSTIVSPTISNPTFAGTLTFPNASIADAALANSYSGVGTCTAGQFVNALNRNAGPTCASPAAGNFAPFVNPTNGQNNYAPLANAALTGNVTINGMALTGGPWLPVNNPTFTGTMTGPKYVITGGVDSLAWIHPSLGSEASMGTGYGSSAASSFLIGQNMYYTSNGTTPWKAGGTTSFPNPTASSIQMYGPSVAITGNTGLTPGQNFTPRLLFSISAQQLTSGGFGEDLSYLPVGAYFTVPVKIYTGGETSIFLGPLDKPSGTIKGGGLNDLTISAGQHFANDTWIQDATGSEGLVMNANGFSFYQAKNQAVGDPSSGVLIGTLNQSGMDIGPGSLFRLGIDQFRTGKWNPVYGCHGGYRSMDGYANGSWTTVGNIVYFTASGGWSVASGGAGAAYIGGLPFPAWDDTGAGYRVNLVMSNVVPAYSGAPWNAGIRGTVWNAQTWIDVHEDQGSSGFGYLIGLDCARAYPNQPSGFWVNGWYRYY